MRICWTKAHGKQFSLSLCNKKESEDSDFRDGHSKKEKICYFIYIDLNIDLLTRVLKDHIHYIG